jgi:hypothetical protein
LPVTVNDVLDSIADAAHLAGGRAALQPFWTGIATRALPRGQRDILSGLGALGLTTTQILTWTGYDSAVLQQAEFWALVEGGATLPAPPAQQDIEALDLREWLKEAVLTDALGAVIRADPSSGIVGHGDLAEGWSAVKAKEPDRRQGFTDRSGRFMRW